MNTYPENPPEDLICKCGRHLPCRHCDSGSEGIMTNHQKTMTIEQLITKVVTSKEEIENDILGGCLSGTDLIDEYTLGGKPVQIQVTVTADQAEFV